jgi:hypothetical protein
MCDRVKDRKHDVQVAGDSPADGHHAGTSLTSSVLSPGQIVTVSFTGLSAV